MLKSNAKIHLLVSRWVPPNCNSCNYYLGGSYSPVVKPIDAKLLTLSVASVRKNPTGIPVRVLVNLQENKVNKPS